jgi:hypothetical protein
MPGLAVKARATEASDFRCPLHPTRECGRAEAMFLLSLFATFVGFFRKGKAMLVVLIVISAVAVLGHCDFFRECQTSQTSGIAV